MRTNRAHAIHAWLVASVLVMLALTACQKKASPVPAAAASSRVSEKELRESVASLEPQLSQLSEKYTTLGRQLEAIRPDLPGYGELRAKYYATDEGMGVMGPKLTRLSARLDAAVSSKKPEDLLQVSTEVAHTREELRQIDRISLELLHQILHLQSPAKAEQDEQK